MIHMKNMQICDTTREYVSKEEGYRRPTTKGAGSSL